MSQSVNSPQVQSTLATIRTNLSADGLDLNQLAARMRLHGPEADRTRQIPDAVCAPSDVPALNLNLVPAAYGGCMDVQSLTSRATLMEYLGYADAALALALPGPGLAMPPVLALGSGEQQARFFERFRSDTPRWGAADGE